MVSLLLVLLVSPFQDAQRLGYDSFEVRSQATTRLRYNPLGLPAILWASKQRDLEQRRRGERLLMPWKDAGITVLALWLFYGPKDMPDRLMDRYDPMHFLHMNEKFVEDLPVGIHLALADKARYFRLLGKTEPIELAEGLRRGWVNEIRRRVHNRSLRPAK